MKMKRRICLFINLLDPTEVNNLKYICCVSIVMIFYECFVSFIKLSLNDTSHFFFVNAELLLFNIVYKEIASLIILINLKLLVIIKDSGLSNPPHFSV